MGAANRTNILGHAKLFLDEIEEKRRECCDRPLVFVAHSLGGLLVKAVLRQAFETDPEPANGRFFHQILTLAIGTVFLGTPHRGSDYIDLAKIMSDTANAVQLNRSKSLLTDLKPDASILEILNETFLHLVEKYRFQLITFEEGRGPGIPFMPREKIVRSWSAHLGLNESIEQKYVINANH